MGNDDADQHRSGPGIFNSRLNVIANYYNSISTDILYNAPISAISGFTSSTTNMTDAKIRNRGFDLQVAPDC